MCLLLGASGVGKTLLVKRLQNILPLPVGRRARAGQGWDAHRDPLAPQRRHLPHSRSLTAHTVELQRCQGRPGRASADPPHGKCPPSQASPTGNSAASVRWVANCLQERDSRPGQLRLQGTRSPPPRGHFALHYQEPQFAVTSGPIFVVGVGPESQRASYFPWWRALPKSLSGCHWQV